MINKACSCGLLIAAALARIFSNISSISCGMAVGVKADFRIPTPKVRSLPGAAGSGSRLLASNACRFKSVYLLNPMSSPPLTINSMASLWLRIIWVSIGDLSAAGIPSASNLSVSNNEYVLPSSRLEGNTYSLLDTERLLAEGIPAADKSPIETQMILNHKDAIEFMVSGGEDIGFNRYTLLNLHALLANNLLPDPAAPGRLRTFGVGIRKSAFTPTAIPQLIEEMFEKILAKAAAINNPHVQALFIMVQLPYLQPFEDVNKRVSRLAANISLNQHNLVPISFIGVPEDVYIKGLLGVYELNQVALLKDIFLLACARSADRYASVRQTISEPDPFRIQYRQLLQPIVTEIIAGQMDHQGASIIIRARAVQLPSP